MRLRASEFGVRRPFTAPFSTESPAPTPQPSSLGEALRHHPTDVSFQFPILS